MSPYNNPLVADRNELEVDTIDLIHTQVYQRRNANARFANKKEQVWGTRPFFIQLYERKETIFHQHAVV